MLVTLLVVDHQRLYPAHAIARNDAGTIRVDIGAGPDEGQLLPKDFDRSKELCMGADGTPTLNIDKVAEDVIVEYISKNGIPLNILSEEAGYIDNHAEKTLVIDP